MPRNPTIGDRIRFFSRRAGITDDSALAGKVGVTKGAVAHWMAGRHRPWKYFAKLLRVLGTTESEFWTTTIPPKSPAGRMPSKRLTRTIAPRMSRAAREELLEAR